MVFWLALRSRLLVVAWCIAADFLLPDHQPRDVLLYTIDQSPPSLPLCLLKPFTRWDSAHFLTIARDGYRTQRDVAFFPGFPWLVSSLARATTAVSSVSSHVVIIIFGVLISNLAFIAAACGVRAAAGTETARAFCLSPAAVFFSTNYAESLFAALTFWGIAHARNSRFNTATLLLAMAATVRANGVLGAILLLDGSVLSAVRATFVMLPFALHEAVSRARFRAAGSSTWPPPLSLYVDVQRDYWDVGFCHYWRFKQVPNFMLAAPALMLASAGLFSLPRTPDKGVLVLHTLASLCLLIFVSHVEIATRLLAASSLPFLQALSSGLRSSTLVRLYVACFIVLGTAAHVNNLPWT